MRWIGAIDGRRFVHYVRRSARRRGRGERQVRGCGSQAFGGLNLEAAYAGAVHFLQLGRL